MAARYCTQPAESTKLLSTNFGGLTTYETTTAFKNVLVYSGSLNEDPLMYWDA